MVRQLLRHNIQTRRPLAEDDCLGAGFLGGGFEDVEEGFELAAGDGCVDVRGYDSADFGTGFDEVVFAVELGTAHWAFVLGFDDALDALAAEGMAAGGDDGVVEDFVADGAFLGLLLEVNLP